MVEKESFRIESLKYKPVKRYYKDNTKLLRSNFERNVKGEGVFARAVVHCMLPAVEDYFRKGQVVLITMSSEGVVLHLNDNSLVRAF